MEKRSAPHAGQWRGRDLGTRTVAYDERDAILYALAVGAGADDLDLVFERNLRVLPTFALTLAQWAPDVLAGLGAFGRETALHGAQRLTVRRVLPPSGELTCSATVTDVWDKGSAAVFDVTVESEYFTAVWSIFAPGLGGFGGERGPGRPPAPQGDAPLAGRLETFRNQAALYRLTGDRHLIHIDPEAAAGMGQPRPILHGLCTLAATVLRLARLTGAHPADLEDLEGRFAAPVLPGQVLGVSAWPGAEGSASFQVGRGDQAVLTGGLARFAKPAAASATPLAT
ncbi:3-alpha,7-alpha,12-alpha-trihydroxy-5-beta-cholest-24-enoyl-CoA hydratase [Streptomyces pilosus]|uniref:MaoC/PaaZ C-terminal domain-containing protein n=1 Tax=Streptomyces pilosus TaxID=28893 RepID=UPI00167AF1C5|nr:MaoC/PaaZ C-terminal domain-containing protein [Streptomyces pilosus]GGV45978.1 3-alpha,7-alpha,12-alpha-trihydroxy-5-beta-cholest-24-enoyl-CoA hydratase [Streptomyces pilosus]